MVVKVVVKVVVFVIVVVVAVVVVAVVVVLVVVVTVVVDAHAFFTMSVNTPSWFSRSSKFATFRTCASLVAKAVSCSLLMAAVTPTVMIVLPADFKSSAIDFACVVESGWPSVTRMMTDGVTPNPRKPVLRRFLSFCQFWITLKPPNVFVPPLVAAVSSTARAPCMLAAS